jgi:hypothetical protein
MEGESVIMDCLLMIIQVFHRVRRFLLGYLLNICREAVQLNKKIGAKLVMSMGHHSSQRTFCILYFAFCIWPRSNTKVSLAKQKQIFDQWPHSKLPLPSTCTLVLENTPDHPGDAFVNVPNSCMHWIQLLRAMLFHYCMHWFWFLRAIPSMSLFGVKVEYKSKKKLKTVFLWCSQIFLTTLSKSHQQVLEWFEDKKFESEL